MTVEVSLAAINERLQRRIADDAAIIAMLQVAYDAAEAELAVLRDPPCPHPDSLPG